MLFQTGCRRCGCNIALFSCVDLVDHGFSEGLQYFSFVVVEVPFDLVDAAVFYHPQLTLGLCDEPSVVAHDDHGCEGER